MKIDLIMTAISEDTEMEGSFMLSRVRRLHKGSAPCTEETSTSLTSCIKVFLLTILMTCNPNTSGLEEVSYYES